MMKMLRTHGTTLTVGLFLVSTVSGIFLFFHLYSSAFHAMHEWLSMVLLIPVGLHVWRNWPGFIGYFKRKTIYMPLILSVVAGLAFAYPALTSNGGGKNPMRAAVGALQNGTVAQVAPLFKLTPEALSQQLNTKGYKITSPTQTLRDIAQSSGKPLGPSLVADLLPAQK